MDKDRQGNKKEGALIYIQKKAGSNVVLTNMCRSSESDMSGNCHDVQSEDYLFASTKKQGQKTLV